MTEIALRRGRSAESLLLGSSALLLHAAALWLLHASLRAPTQSATPPPRVTVQLLPAPVAASPAAPAPPPRPAAPRREGRPALPARVSEAATTAPAPVDQELAAPGPALDSLPLELQRSTREAIREMERHSRGVAQAPRASEALPPSETALGRGIARATRPDCKDAYAGAGLLAIPLMLYEAAGGTGTNCRWR